ncbi:MAG: hypothetical protein ACREH6_14475, partial [Geminicoccaceae bacterium]
MSRLRRAAPLCARAARLLGWLATGLALGFVGWRLAGSDAWRIAGDHPERLALTILLGALAYALASFLLAEAWRQLLGPSATKAPARSYHALYGRTQIAKYLPGNVLHFAGRQILGRELGHGQAALALASLLETLLLLLVAAILAVPLASRSLDAAWLRGGWMPAVGAVALIAAGAGLWLARSHAGLPVPKGWRRADGEAIRLEPYRLWRAALLYAVFFASAGGLLWMLTLTLDQGRPELGRLVICIEALAAAWAIGFVTPGASAGLGVREAVLIMALQGELGGQASTLVALTMRLVTIGGDALFFALSLPSPGRP